MQWQVPIHGVLQQGQTEVEEAVQNGGLSPADQDIISSTRTFMEREYDAVIQEILALRERAGLSSPGSTA